MTDEERLEFEKLKKENEELKKKTSHELRLKVSQKGAVSLYGLGRFPVTLYKEQWIKVLNFQQNIKDFIKEHDSELATKNSKA